MVLFSKKNQKEVATVQKIKSFSLPMVELVKKQYFNLLSVGGMLILKMKMELYPILCTIIIMYNIIKILKSTW